MGLTRTAVSFGLRGDEVSIKMYQPLAENKNTVYIFLTLLGPMEFSIELHTLKAGWSIVFLSLKIDLFIAKSADADEMPRCVWVFTV